MRSIRATICLPALTLALCGPVSAQSRRDTSDITFDPAPLEVLSAKRGAFAGPLNVPIFDPHSRVRVAVFESVPGPNFGDPPSRRPLPELSESLVRALHDANRGWSFAPDAPSSIEIMVVRERSHDAECAFTVYASWFGFATPIPMQGTRPIGLQVYRTDDVAAVFARVVDDVKTGAVIVGAP